MQINFINPVLSACTGVLVSMADLKLKVGKPYKRKSDEQVTDRRVVSLISVPGE